MKSGRDRRKLCFAALLPAVQLVLTLVSVAVHLGVNGGRGEGDNQLAANLISNVELVIKQLLGFDDIVNYRFRILTATLGLAVWLAAGLAVDGLIGLSRRRRVKG